MYNLETNDINNENIKQLIHKYPERAQEIREKASLNPISYIIFNNTLDQKTINTCMVSLTLGDELKHPLNKNVCDILFFSLCANIYLTQNNIKFRIKNFHHAQLLFDLYNNDYKSIVIEDDDRTYLKKLHYDKLPKFIFPETPISFDFLISFFRKDGVNYCTLSGAEYCFINIKNETYKIPRLLFIKLFKDALTYGRLICTSTDDIRNSVYFCSQQDIEDILNYVGYFSSLHYKNIIIPNDSVLNYNFKIETCIIDSWIENDDRWLITDEYKGILLPNKDYIAILNNVDDDVRLLVK